MTSLALVHTANIEGGFRSRNSRSVVEDSKKKPFQKMTLVSCKHSTSIYRSRKFYSVYGPGILLKIQFSFQSGGWRGERQISNHLSTDTTWRSRSISIGLSLTWPSWPNKADVIARGFGCRPLPLMAGPGVVEISGTIILAGIWWGINFASIRPLAYYPIRTKWPHHPD